MLSSLIKQVLDFVNLGKVIVDGGPGVVLAIALSILLASLAQLPVLPYSTQAAELLGQACPEAGPWQPTFEPENRLEERLVELKRKMCNLEGGLADAQETKAREDAEVARLNGLLEAQKSQLGTLETEVTERAAGDRIETQSLRGRLSELSRRHFEDLSLLQNALAQQAKAVLEVTSTEAELAALAAEFNQRMGERITSLRGLFAYLVDHLIGLALVGWVLGTMMNPFNRWLLEVWYGGGPLRGVVKRMMGKGNTPPQAQPPTVGRSVPGSVPGSAPAALSDLRFQSAMAWKSEAAAEKCLGVTIDESCFEALARLVATRSATFFIGRKIISKAERDDLVASYHRWAEVSVNLAIPLVVLSASLFRVGYASEAPRSMYLGSLISLVLAAIAFFRGRQALAVHHEREAQFLIGRLVSMASAAQEAAGALSEVVARSITDLEDLLQRIKQARVGGPEEPAPSG